MGSNLQDVLIVKFHVFLANAIEKYLCMIFIFFVYYYYEKAIIFCNVVFTRRQTHTSEITLFKITTCAINPHIPVRLHDYYPHKTRICIM